MTRANKGMKMRLYTFSVATCILASLGCLVYSQVGPATGPAATRTPFPTTTPATNPWPNKLDAFGYQHSTSPFGATWSLGLNREGKVHYSFQSLPGTGSGGETVVKDWQIPPAEAARILDAVATAGVLELPGENGRQYPIDGVSLSACGWQKRLNTTKMPEGVLHQIQPLIDFAHPDLGKWKEGRGPATLPSSTRTQP